MPKKIKIPLAILFLAMLALGCQDKKKKEAKETDLKATVSPKADLAPIKEIPNIGADIDTIILSSIHHPNAISCDLDGDDIADTVKLVQNIRNKKYGLKVILGNKKVTYLGMGKDVLGQGFDDLNWVGVFERAPKGDSYWNNVNADGEIISEEEVKEKDKVKLPNDGIFIHEAEACGGGVIYLNKGKFEWIQQE